MPDQPRYPTLDEFWRRLSEREVESDLRDALEQRTSRERQPAMRLPADAVAAVAARLLPGAVPPEALAAFLDGHYDHQLGRADDKAGVLPRPELIPTGFAALDDAAQARYRLGLRGPRRRTAGRHPRGGGEGRARRDWRLRLGDVVQAHPRVPAPRVRLRPARDGGDGLPRPVVQARPRLARRGRGRRPCQPHEGYRVL